MKKIISIILSISLTIFIPITLFLFCTNSYIKGTSMKKVIRNIDKEVFIDGLTVNLLNINEENNELMKAINESGLTQEVTAIAFEKLGNYIKKGKDEKIITKEEGQALVDKYFDNIIKEMGKDITKEEKEVIKEKLNTQYIKLEKQMPKISEFGKGRDTPFYSTINITRNICNPILRYIACGITIILIVLLIFIQKKNWNYILYISIPTIISSIMTLSILKICKIIIQEILKEESKNFIVLTTTMFLRYISKIYTIEIILLILSVIAILFLIINRKKEKKAN